MTRWQTHPNATRHSAQGIPAGRGRAGGSLARFAKRLRRKITWGGIPLVAFIGRMLILAIGATVRLRVRGADPGAQPRAHAGPLVYAFFHGRQNLLISHMSRARRSLVLMTGVNYLGEVQSLLLSSLGFSIVRGSSTRGGMRALAGMVREMREGRDSALAVDGPRGPHHEVKPGVLFLAKKLAVPIVPFTSSASPAWIHGRAWDRYLLPLPFARGLVLFGEPWHPGPDLSPQALARDADELRRRLEALDEEADRAVGR
jgi:lysophospholipid acyltransferase (LPLAT)-like uncharacterized protein